MDSGFIPLDSSILPTPSGEAKGTSSGLSGWGDVDDLLTEVDNSLLTGLDEIEQEINTMEQQEKDVKAHKQKKEMEFRTFYVCSALALVC